MVLEEDPNLGKKAAKTVQPTTLIDAPLIKQHPLVGDVAPHSDPNHELAGRSIGWSTLRCLSRCLTPATFVGFSAKVKASFEIHPMSQLSPR